MSQQDKELFEQVLKLATQFKEKFERSLRTKTPQDERELVELREKIEALGYFMTFVQVNDEDGNFKKLQLAVARVKKPRALH